MSEASMNDEELRRQHAAVWAALDEIAARRGISIPRLAVQSGHDKSSFNRSKRDTSGGLRWPTMETIARVLALHEMTFEQFGALVDEKMGSAQ